MNNMKNKIIVGILAVFFLSFIFYWFEIRPANARSYCNWSVKWGPDKPKKIESIKSIINNYYPSETSDYLSEDKYDFLYKSCLRSKGISN
ncbi:MAG: hypothetical protein PHS06_01290 [Candidatus Shapirobacteria bacterium]|nr:hypothetical protein [Candidatus Shapirobacteria bacterium]